MNLSKIAIDRGGSLHPLIIPSELTNGTGLMNPSIYVDSGRLLVNVRHVNYTLYHSENQRFQHKFGPLQYLNPEDDVTLRTWNYLCELNEDFTFKSINKVDTSEFDTEPLWEFIGLEDARLVRWDNNLYLCGVRRDTTTHGEGRMELSLIENNKEVSRIRIPAPGDNTTYCEKNWMPILDKPYHWVKWSNPTEVVKFDLQTNTSVTKHLSKTFVPNMPSLRGSSHVIPYKDYYIAITHEVDLIKPVVGQKDATYLHRFIVWDKNWNVIKITEPFSFMGAYIEFCCGLTEYKGDFLITFGFQDNCAFILKVPTYVIEDYVGISTSKFDWGKLAENTWFRNTVETEVFKDNVYQKFFSVEADDVVVDIGASVGPFAYQIAKQQPSRIICLEPEIDLYRTLVNNTQDLPVTALNYAIGNTYGRGELGGLYDPDIIEITDSNLQTVNIIDLPTLIEQQNLSTIDFLKMDCEGGEYNLFTDDNFEWVTKNIKKMAMEIHLHTPEQKNKFKKFRDTYLRHFNNYQVLSLDYVDIKHKLFTDWFLEYYSAIMIYVDNRKQLPVWNQYQSPTLEITTIIPEKGCVVDCAFCPQETLKKAYTGDRILSLDNFKKLVDRTPKEIRITFAGFVEPWMNKNCTDMLIYAHEQRHPVSVFTTGVGMSIEDCERIIDIPYAPNPNGGFVLHLPDAEGLAKHPMTASYLQLLDWFSVNGNKIQNFMTMSMGQLKPELAELFPNNIIYQMFDRAGNVSREAIVKPELNNLKERWIKIYHKDEKTCGCPEHLYHNVLLPNGDVTLCCMDYGLEYILGNLYEQDYKDIVPKANTCFNICSKCENGVDFKNVN